jgi:hypothetical protein
MENFFMQNSKYVGKGIPLIFEETVSDFEVLLMQRRRAFSSRDCNLELIKIYRRNKLIL